MTTAAHARRPRAHTRRTHPHTPSVHVRLTGDELAGVHGFSPARRQLARRRLLPAAALQGQVVDQNVKHPADARQQRGSRRKGLPQAARCRSRHIPGRPATRTNASGSPPLPPKHRSQRPSPPAPRPGAHLPTAGAARSFRGPNSFAKASNPRAWCAMSCASEVCTASTRCSIGSMAATTAAGSSEATRVGGCMVRERWDRHMHKLLFSSPSKAALQKNHHQSQAPPPQAHLKPLLKPTPTYPTPSTCTAPSHAAHPAAWPAAARCCRPTPP